MIPVVRFAVHKWLENFAYKTGLSWWIFTVAGLLVLFIALLTVSWQSSHGVTWSDTVTKQRVKYLNQDLMDERIGRII